MSEHLPECPVYRGPCCPWMGDCKCQCCCDMLRACEQRVREEERALVAVERTTLAELNAEYQKGVQAAREAVVAVACAGQGAALPPREWVHTQSTLAAIDALREAPHVDPCDCDKCRGKA